MRGYNVQRKAGYKIWASIDDHYIRTYNTEAFVSTLKHKWLTVQVLKLQICPSNYHDIETNYVVGEAADKNVKVLGKV